MYSASQDVGIEKTDSLACVHKSEGFCRQGLPGKLSTKTLQQGQYMYVQMIVPCHCNTFKTHKEAQDTHATLPAKSLIAEFTRGACVMP